MGTGTALASQGYMRLAWLVVASLAVGCADPSSDPCSDVADHIASCTDEQASAASAVCDPERAEAILTMDCDELAATAMAAKADGWWDGFMCTLGFTSYCTGSGSGSGSGTPAPTTKTLTGHVYKTGTFDQEATNVYVRAIREGAQTETRGTWVVQGLFAIQNLPTAKYRLEISYTTTSSALTTSTVDLGTTTYVVLYAPVP